ncbi:MAG TPA: T9SS type A sorting domain-containing protein [Saprospiraceae bacterium]|nr:T9SS type A sorting domain-containing protein [Saprospiraceae bacterium]
MRIITSYFKIASVLALVLTFILPLQAQQTIYGSIQHDGLEREYILYVPASYSSNTPVPLVLNFHGYTSNAFEQMFYGDFRSIADTAGFLVVHPMGTIDLVGNAHWNVGWGTSSVDDVGFTSALIDSLSAQYNINQDRVYSTGMSNGGFMSYYLACELSDRIAAIASVTGSMNVNELGPCDPQHQTPVMEIHGTADPTVAYDGNILFAPIPTVINYWVDYNNCNTPADITALPDTDPNDGCTAEHHVYTNGTNGASVEHYKIIDGLHTWPGSAFGGVGTNQDMDASKEIWRFFSKYDIHGLIIPTAIHETAPENAISIYPNPANWNVTIETQSNETFPYTITNMMGQEIISGHTQAQRNVIDIHSFPVGVYIIKIENQTFVIAKQ